MPNARDGPGRKWLGRLYLYLSGREEPTMMIHSLLENMVESGASDLYLTAGAPVMMRVHNEVLPVGEKILEPADTEEISFGLMDATQRGDFSRTSEMNLAFNLESLGRFRTNVFRQRGSIGLVIRYVKLDIPSIEELNLPPILKDLITRPRGLVLVTGATGSGKSTTLASMIDYRNRTTDGHIISLEDPIEYVHRHHRSIVNQREIGLDSECYEIAMKNVLRQAPDVILVGEIRDRQAMDQVMSYAETGHLVLSTLHSTNANQTIQRVIQFFPKDIESKVYEQLSQTLQAVISQRLVSRADGGGLVPAVEVMITSARIKELVGKGETGELKEVIEASRQDGMQTFDQCLYKLVSIGMVTEEHAFRAADSPGDLKLRLQGLGSGVAVGH